jgi:ketosteroid isomerase-like protein
MLDRNVVVGAIKAHCQTLTEHDKEGWLSLWADNVVLEDPVSVDTFHGIDSLRTTFWGLVELTSPLRLELKDDVIVCGNEAVAILSSESNWGGTPRNVGPLVDHFTFGPGGKITRMRAHWHFARHGYRPEMAIEAADRDRMVAAVKTHCRASWEGDKESWVKLFADDVVIEDPVGSGAIYRGIEAASTTFWERSKRAKPRLQLTEEIIVCGKEAVAILAAEVGPDDARRRIAPIVDHFTFDDDGRIIGMRAFFNY